VRFEGRALHRPEAEPAPERQRPVVRVRDARAQFAQSHDPGLGLDPLHEPPGDPLTAGFTADRDPVHVRRSPVPGRDRVADHPAAIERRGVARPRTRTDWYGRGDPPDPPPSTGAGPTRRPRTPVPRAGPTRRSHAPIPRACPPPPRPLGRAGSAILAEAPDDAGAAAVHAPAGRGGC